MLTAVTVANNTAGAAGGIFHDDTALSGTTTTVGSTIVGKNWVGGTASDCGGTINSADFNLIGTTAGCTYTTQSNDLTGEDPLLAPLANNGGPTLTHLPLVDSPAVDEGDNTICANPATINNLDQRGQTRPFDGDGDLTATCDIGAVERQSTVVPTLSISSGSGFESNTTTITFTVTLTGVTDGASMVNYATANNTATAGSDYIAKNGTLVFAPGVTTRSIVITLRGDAVVEGDETFFVNLSSPTNATITDNQGQGTITNSTVTLTKPANNATSKDNTPLFSWAAVAGAAQYRLQVDNNSDFASPAIDLAVTGTSYMPTTALGDAKYYWRVQARNAAGSWGGWCTRWVVTVDTTPPARPTLLSPANGATITDSTPLFRWKAVSGAAKYTLQMDDNSNFASPIINRTLTTMSFTQPSALVDKRYYWRVRAQDAAGNLSAWSIRWSFTVNAVPLAQPTLIPTNTPRPTRTPPPTLVPTATVAPTNVPTATATEITSLMQVVESDNSLVVQSGGWAAYGEPSTSGGSYLLSSTLTDTLALAFVGSDVTVVYIQHPSVGSFAIEVDGAVMQVVDGIAAESVFGAEVTISGLVYGQHTVRVYPVSGVVAIDAFKVEMALQIVVPTETPVPTDLPAGTPVPTDVPMETPVPTDIPTEVPTQTPVPTDIPTEVPTETPVPTEASTLTPVPTDVPTEVPVEVVPPVDSTEEPAS
jgi:hypothetical protein